MLTDVLYNACLSLQTPSFVQSNMDMMVTSSDEEEADIENISPFDYKPRMYCSSELKYPSSTYVYFLFTSHFMYVCQNNQFQTWCLSMVLLILNTAV